MSKVILEVCVDTPESVNNAINGGADRLELCSSLILGGLTPSPGLAKYALSQTNIPCYALIRPRNGNFVYSTAEVDIMVDDIYLLKKLGVTGFVIGALTPKGQIDIDSIQRLKESAQGCDITFHRAFDHIPTPYEAMDKLIDMGIQRILTSGQQTSAEQGIELIKSLQAHAGNRLSLMAGAGVDEYNAAKIISATGIKEIHASCKVKRNCHYESLSNLSMGSESSFDHSIFVTSENIVSRIKSKITDLV
ncbi:copper homeostasis protein CutC (plasmid) [Photobacterium sp. DA100]|uniref:copper homeostasis protein CutC n=1 Tax=Photobacterium sp. DA100 TaxID=3027472 RepID=UPI002478B9FC|nr:copper homeostasis protein CutC [Photobacterium sp. DA100]WEM44521.1 copper homeostasis protein CutC [Photobacterium sp. DA100]